MGEHEPRRRFCLWPLPCPAPARPRPAARVCPLPPLTRDPSPLRRQGSRFARPRRQGARPDAEGRSSGEEEEDRRARQEEAAVQPAIRQRRRGCGQEARTQHAAARQDGLKARAAPQLSPPSTLTPALCPRGAAPAPLARAGKPRSVLPRAAVEAGVARRAGMRGVAEPGRCRGDGAVPELVAGCGVAGRGWARGRPAAAAPPPPRPLASLPPLAARRRPSRAAAPLLRAARRRLLLAAPSRCSTSRPRTRHSCSPPPRPAQVPCERCSRLLRCSGGGRGARDVETRAPHSGLVRDARAGAWRDRRCAAAAPPHALDHAGVA